MAFVSPVFLFPNDAGGKIRTTNILRGLKGGSFDLTLLSPATAEQRERWHGEIEGVSDEFLSWSPAPTRSRWRRAVHLLDELPVNVVADRTAPGRDAVRQLNERTDIDLFVFDFVHSAVLAPPKLRAPTLCFTHNVEAEIFERHARQSSHRAKRWLWASQHRKMLQFESRALRRFDKVVAVSERDALFFKRNYGVDGAEVIPTGVDLDFFAWQIPPPSDARHPPTVVFTGSMDWSANIDGIRWFLEQVWPRLLRRIPMARFIVVGRDPPHSLRSAAGPQVEFTGFVEDVRPYVHMAHAFVIPLLVGGGTRIKAFEAMAMGSPVVSTAIGIEGLEARPGDHYLGCDDPDEMAEAIGALLENQLLRETLSVKARAFVESRFGHRCVAGLFEDICRRTLAP